MECITIFKNYKNKDKQKIIFENTSVHARTPISQNALLAILLDITVINVFNK